MLFLSHFGYARVNFESTNRSIREHFAKSDNVQIITGFIGTSESGETTTLGRSGSDYTSAIFAGALKSESLEIWTDVDGMMTGRSAQSEKGFHGKGDDLRRGDGVVALWCQGNFSGHHATCHEQPDTYLDQEHFQSTTPGHLHQP